MNFYSDPKMIEGSLSDVAEKLQLPIKRKKPSAKMIIGRREWLALPDLGIDLISAKVDTGAYTSSLHAQDVEAFSENDTEWVRFLTQNHHGDDIECRAQVVRKKRIKSSTGHAKARYLIETFAQAAGGFSWRLQLSLADRSDMKCPLLLGRKALTGYFVVDTQHSHLFGNVQEFTGKPHHKKS